MGATLRVTRTAHTAADLRAAAGRFRDGAQVRRLLALAMAMVLDGRPRSEAAQQNGMDWQILRDWVHRYNEGGIEGPRSSRGPGAPPALTAEQKAELRTLVLSGPDQATHVVVRWWCLDLREEVAHRFGVVVHGSTNGK